MEIAISPKTERKIENLLETGRFQSMDDLLDAAIEMLLEQEKRSKFEQLRADLHLGYQQCEQGECMPLDIGKIKELGRQRLTGKA